MLWNVEVFACHNGCMLVLMPPAITNSGSVHLIESEFSHLRLTIAAPLLNGKGAVCAKMAASYMFTKADLLHRLVARPAFVDVFVVAVDAYLLGDFHRFVVFVFSMAFRT